MNNYNVNWNGLDRGHENFWSPDLWRGVLNTFALNSPVDLNDVNGVFYETLRAQFPSVQWVTSASDGQVCSVFREGREAWDSTGVVLFQKGSSIASITSLGKKVVEGLVSYADVLAAVALLKEEKGEHPFSILLEALRKAPDGRGLSLDDVIKVMHHYRPGDDINEVLSAPRESLSGVPLRRLRAILLLMTYAGLAIQKDGMYFAGHDPSNYIKITGDDLREAFSRWLNDENIEGSGKAASYIGALDSADVIAQAYCPNFKCPSVYEMPDSSLESLRDFISKEGRKEDKVPGSGLFCGLNEIPKSHWRDGYCIAAIGALIKFKAIFKNMHSADRKDQLPSHLDLLTGALKLFAEKRKEEEWCSDKADGDANKPRAGYVANKQLRVLSKTPADIAKLTGDVAGNIREWFKNYWNVADGTSWLEGLSDADLSGFGPYVAHLLQPGSPAVAKPAKFSNALEAAVKAVITPEETGMYDERVHETLTFLGLIGFAWNKDFDADDLGEVVNAQRIIKRRLKDLGIKRVQESPTADDGQAPDYLTVNEFLWFVKLNLNRIEKEVQEGKMKPSTHIDIDAAQKAKKPKVNINDSEDVLLLRLRAALRTKPFAILAGHSGTGKSRMVRKLAYMTCNDNALRYVLDDAGNIKQDEHGNDIFLKEPGNFCMVQVKPNWHDSSDLLGYYSELGKRYRSTDFVEFICKAYAYPNTPFFVCLDEMNLAPVEQYFAEYLSAIESRKLTSGGVLTTDELIAKSAYTKEDATGKSVMYEWLGCTMTESQQWLETYGLTIPRNLFVVGTVNMDETTNQFSRKVLDRAMTIEMTDADFDSFGAKSPELKFDDEYMGDDAVKEMLSGEVQAKTLTTDQKDNLNALKTVLAPTSFAVAYRFANEYALYEESLNKTVGSSVKPNPPGTPEEVLTLSEPAAAAAVPSAASPEAAESVSAAEAAPAAEEGTAEGSAPAPAKKDPAIPSAFDDMVLMKVLPRISGDEADVKQIFYEGRVVGKKGTRENPADKTLMKILDVSKDTESLRKIAAILDRGGTYLSFWP